MNDTLLVRRFEPIGNLLRQREGFVQRKRTARDPLSERLAFDELHNEELSAFAFFEAVESGDVRVVELSEQPSFALESGQPLFVSGKLFGEGFDRDIPPEFSISSSIHLASSRQESPKATGRCLCSLFAACFRGGATLSHPYFG